MLVSLNLLNKIITLPRSTTSTFSSFDETLLAEILTRQGFEVEKVSHFGKDYQDVVVGKIIKKDSHPDSQKLSICQVSVGSNKLQIVCGAANARENLFVAVALPGAHLPKSSKLTEGLTIKPTQIRGVDSFGMLCSRDELNLSNDILRDGNGIWEIDNEISGGRSANELTDLLGRPVFSVLGMADTLFELGVTPNRPDILSHVGVAREVFAGLNYRGISCEYRNYQFFSATKDQLSSLSHEKLANALLNSNTIETKDFVFHSTNSTTNPAFFILLDNVKISSSPAWLRNTLDVLDVKSINNIIDISNFLLLYYGQPTHVYDFDKLFHNEKKCHLDIRNASEKEIFIGLDNQEERELSLNDIVVSDGKSLHAILGVMGGENSKVTLDTQRVVIEFATVDSTKVRKTSRRFGIQSQSGFLFEKGIDETSRMDAAVEFVSLCSLTSASVPDFRGAMFSVNTSEKHPHASNQDLLSYFGHNTKDNLAVYFAHNTQQKVLGKRIVSENQEKEILSYLGFSYTASSGDLTVFVPSWRKNDICNENDIAEELIRIHGMDCVNAEPLLSQATVSKDDESFHVIEKASRCLSAMGYNETISYHFTSENELGRCLIPTEKFGKPITVLNPIFNDQPFMQMSLIPNLLQKAEKNFNHSVKKGMFFEVSRTFQENFGQNSNSSIPLYEYNPNFSLSFKYTAFKNQPERSLAESLRIAGMTYGPRFEKEWFNKSPQLWQWFDILSHVYELAHSLEIEIEHIEMKSDHPLYAMCHPGQAAQILCKGEKKFPIGFIAALHPKVLRNYSLENAQSAFVFELNLSALLNEELSSDIKSKEKKNYPAVPQFQALERDFAFVIPTTIKADDLENRVRKKLQDLRDNGFSPQFNLSHFKIFDLFQNEMMASQNKVSTGFKITLQPLDRTFLDKDIQIIQDTLFAFAQEELGAELRS